MNLNELFVGGYDLPEPLSKEEFYNLLEMSSQGDVIARNKLVTHNIRLVLSEVMGKFKAVDYDQTDLMSIGNIGLIKAVNTFDASKKIEFSSYAVRCIDNEILGFLRKLKKIRNIDSLDATVNYDNEGNELKLQDTLCSDIDFIEEYIVNETCQIISKIVNELPETDRRAIMMSFGFYDNKIYTQSEIAEELKISQPSVCRLIKENLKRIARELEKQDIIEISRFSKIKMKSK